MKTVFFALLMFLQIMVVAQIAKPVTNAELKALVGTCLLYTSDAADERSSVDLGGRRIIKKKKQIKPVHCSMYTEQQLRHNKYTLTLQ